MFASPILQIKLGDCHHTAWRISMHALTDYVAWQSSMHVLTECVAWQVYAKAYDNPIPGYQTNTVGNLRLFEAVPVNEFALDAFNEGKYDLAVEELRKANDISAVLYPNDATEYGKELRLKQQVFFVSASIQVCHLKLHIMPLPWRLESVLEQA